MAFEQAYLYAGGGRPLPLSTTAGPFEVREPGRCKPAPLGHVSGRER